MTPRGRMTSFGSAAVLVLAGVGAGLFVDGLVGQLLTIALMLGGLAGAVFLLFLEVGLGEEAERAREQQDRRTQETRRGLGEERPRPRPPRRPPRRRGSG